MRVTSVFRTMLCRLQPTLTPAVVWSVALARCSVVASSIARDRAFSNRAARRCGVFHFFVLVLLVSTTSLTARRTMWYTTYCRSLESRLVSICPYRSLLSIAAPRLRCPRTQLTLGLSPALSLLPFRSKPPTHRKTNARKPGMRDQRATWP